MRGMTAQSGLRFIVPVREARMHVAVLHALGAAALFGASLMTGFDMFP